MVYRLASRHIGAITVKGTVERYGFEKIQKSNILLHTLALALRASGINYKAKFHPYS